MVMSAIEGLAGDVTLIIIAHRLSTLRACTQIVELDGKGGSRNVNFEDLSL